MILWFTLLTGVIYPLIITGISLLTMPEKARGSFITVNNKKVGSLLIGQKFTAPHYFWSRPSAVDFNPLPSGGSNLSPTSNVLKEIVKERQLNLSKAHGNAPLNEIPVDLIYASASGLDPHISLQAVHFQLERVAAARKLDKKQLEQLIATHAQKPFFYLLGDPYINVLELNRALDEVVK